ncbi:hypothetical protein D7B24_004307 [Verticillium nonalfalfae]|uniref:Uncharacterized protein n=1 Tax=Verticillium nonalfalfae TaxID=1051616 RepID=A0A3M9YFJ0_9PEZI|nr:uncharacterized protein D7B24_004307 [Verticillium nonalfalfae]RNJ58672.1 hypothetical protein D7B24_004307 [Verticillium nonalfalfae]
MELPRYLRRPPIRTFALRPLLIPLPLLAVLTLAVIVVHADVNTALLFSQCHARSRLPSVSWIPGLGATLCFALSFFQLALASVRSWAVMAVSLSFLAALLTITIVESSRNGSRPNWLLRRLMLLWLVMNLLGGSIIWQLLIVGSFMLQMGREVRFNPTNRRRLRHVSSASSSSSSNDEESAALAAEEEVEPEAESLTAEEALKRKIRRRHLETDADAVAIPDAVALGFVLPSILMLIYNTPATIGLWLLFPIWVSLFRRAAKTAIHSLQPRLFPSRRRRSALSSNGSHRRTLDLESNRPALALVYLVPVVCSLAAHIHWIWSLTHRDDRRDLTKSTITIIEIDMAFMGVTTLYWLLVEAGLKVVLAVLGVSVFLGPGAGVCAGWYLREKAIRKGHEEDVELLYGRQSSGGAEGAASEQTPLLQ